MPMLPSATLPATVTGYGTFSDIQRFRGTSHSGSRILSRPKLQQCCSSRMVKAKASAPEGDNEEPQFALASSMNIYV